MKEKVLTRGDPETERFLEVSRGRSSGWQRARKNWEASQISEGLNIEMFLITQGVPAKDSLGKMKQGYTKPEGMAKD